MPKTKVQQQRRSQHHYASAVTPQQALPVSPSPHHHSALLALPLEVRLHIFSYLLYTECEPPRFKAIYAESVSSHTHRLLPICLQQHQELAPHLLKHIHCPRSPNLAFQPSGFDDLPKPPLKVSSIPPAPITPSLAAHARTLSVRSAHAIGSESLYIVPHCEIDCEECLPLPDLEASVRSLPQLEYLFIFELFDLPAGTETEMSVPDELRLVRRLRRLQRTSLRRLRVGVNHEVKAAVLCARGWEVEGVEEREFARVVTLRRDGSEVVGGMGEEEGDREVWCSLVWDG